MSLNNAAGNTSCLTRAKLRGHSKSRPDGIVASLMGIHDEPVLLEVSNLQLTTPTGRTLAHFKFRPLFIGKNISTKRRE